MPRAGANLDRADFTKALGLTRANFDYITGTPVGLEAGTHYIPGQQRPATAGGAAAAGFAFGGRRLAEQLVQETHDRTNTTDMH